MVKRTKMFTHQKEALDLSTKNNICGYFMEQGTGKTFPAIKTIENRSKYDGIRKVLIVAPLSVLSEWKRQIREYADFSYNITVLTGTTEQRKNILYKMPQTTETQIVLVNYDVMYKLTSNIILWAPQMMICDESQKIKNGRAKTSKAIHTIGRIVRYKMIMTGTPVTQGPLDVWSQYMFLNPEIFGKSYVRFRDRYAIMGGYFNKEIVGYRIFPQIQGRRNPFYNKELTEEFQQKMYSVAIRVTKEEALDLPEAVTSYRYATLESSARKVYNEMEKEAVIEFTDSRLTAPIVLTKMLRLQQICGGFIRPGEDEDYIQISDAKLKVMEEILEDIKETGSKIVVFAKFIPEIEEIAKRCEDLELKYHMLTGSIKQKDREEMINDFQTNLKTKVFLAQIQTGGVGITLTAASTAVFFSTGYSLIDYEQAKARIHRIGQKNKVNYIHILCEDSIDGDIVGALARKQNISEMTVDELRKVILRQGEMNVRLPKKIEKVLASRPTGSSSEFDSEINRLLKEIEKDLEENDIGGDEEMFGGSIKKETKEVERIKKSKKGKNTVEINFNEKDIKKEVVSDFKDRFKKWNNGERTTVKVTTDKKGKKTVGSVITAKELAEELGMEPRKLRVWLRKQYGTIEGRWEWAPDDPQLNEIRENI